MSERHERIWLMKDGEGELFDDWFDEDPGRLGVEYVLAERLAALTARLDAAEALLDKAKCASVGWMLKYYDAIEQLDAAKSSTGGEP